MSSCIIVQVIIAPNRDPDQMTIYCCGLQSVHLARSGRHSPREHNAAGGGKETALHSPLKFVLASKVIYFVHRSMRMSSNGRVMQSVGCCHWMLKTTSVSCMVLHGWCLISSQVRKVDIETDFQAPILSCRSSVISLRVCRILPSCHCKTVYLLLLLQPG